jgi:hypothetical protein
MRCVPCATGQEGEPLLEPGEHCLRRKHAHAGGRQFDGQRQAIQAMTNLSDGGGRLVVDTEARSDSLRPGDKEPHRLVLGHLFGPGGRLASGETKGRHRIFLLSAQPKRYPARDHDL